MRSKESYYGLETIKIFISHTEDTKRECQIAKDVIKEESNLHYEKQGYKLDAFCWDDIPRGTGDPQEDLIDPRIREDQCKLVVMILWTYFGNPTPKYESGIEHEYNVVKKNRKKILIFFCNRSMPPFSINPAQLKKVQGFKKRIEYERYCGHCGFFGDEKDFEKKLRGQLVANIDKIISESKKIEESFEELDRGF